MIKDYVHQLHNNMNIPPVQQPTNVVSSINPTTSPITSTLLSKGGFFQSSRNNTYLFIKVYPDGSFICLIFSQRQHALVLWQYRWNWENFETSSKGHFQVNILGTAHWFLQMRIHHHANSRVSLDQHCYALNLHQQFVNPASPCSLPPFCNTPAPPDYIWSVSNHLLCKKNKTKSLQNMCLCTILYLAYSTCANILFTICKLA
jgi:hypothetical protein